MNLKYAGAVAAILLTTAASAAAEPIKAAQGAAFVEAGGFYVWADGSYQAIRLPKYNLGFASTGLGEGNPGPYGGQIQSIDPRPGGGAFSGAIGFVLPHSPLGSNFRFEIGGSYVGASANQSGETRIEPSSQSFQMLNGQMIVSSACENVCTIRTTLATDYAAWQLDGRLATDFKNGTITFTPWLGVFGGTSRASQTYSLVYDNQNPAGLLDTYSANTQLRWTDWGGRLGLNTRVGLTSALSLGLSGSVALADRRTTLNGSDAFGFIPGGLYSSSAITSLATRSAFLANAEVNLGYQLTAAIGLRAFAGLNFDNAVPGIMAPSFTGPFSFAAPVTAASITYAAETSYYAGGGVVVRFTP